MFYKPSGNEIEMKKKELKETSIEYMRPYLEMNEAHKAAGQPLILAASKVDPPAEAEGQPK